LSEPPPPDATLPDEASEEESDYLHAAVGWVLRGGLLISVLLLAGGMALRLASGESDAPPVRLWDLQAGDFGLTLTTLGILVLALTPGLRVLALVVLWWRQKDFRFVAVALAVAATLITGALLGRGG
jgi:uncharacterized membrane protein